MILIEEDEDKVEENSTEQTLTQQDEDDAINKNHYNK